MHAPTLCHDIPPASTLTALTLTPAATARLRDLIAEEGGDVRLRIFVQGGGCAGFQYGFAFDEAAAEDDLLIEYDGVGVLVDVMSLQYLAGATVDFEDGLDGARFVIRNPNAASSCGCGSSFSV